MNPSKRDQEESVASSQPEHHEWVKVGIINNDADADLISSLFEHESLPCVMHGRNHRRMFGFLGGQVIELRLLVPRARLEEAESLLKLYYERQAGRGDQPAQLTPDEMISAEEEQDLVFGSRKKRAAIALFCGLFIGFGSASLIAGAWWFTLILAPLQLLDHWPAAAARCGELTGASAETIHHVAIAVPLIDLGLALLTLFFISPMYLKYQSRSTSDHTK